MSSPQDTSTVSIQEPEWSKDLKIYPNPNSGRFFVEASGIQKQRLLLEIMDHTEDFCNKK